MGSTAIYRYRPVGSQGSTAAVGWLDGPAPREALGGPDRCLDQSNHWRSVRNGQINEAMASALDARARGAPEPWGTPPAQSVGVAPISDSRAIARHRPLANRRALMTAFA